MSVAAVAESVLTYSFTVYISFNATTLPTTPIVKDHQHVISKDSWRLSFYYGGYSYDSSVSLSLTARNECDCSFSVKLSVLDGERQSKLDLVRKGWNNVGSSQTFSLPNQVISGLEQSGQLALQMTVTMIPKSSKSEELATLFKSESFGDVEIECADGEKFRCHKDMLAAKSHHFATMFNVGMKESVENRVLIEDFGSDVVSVLLRFCYLGYWGDLSSVADRLYMAADRYQLEQLKWAAAAELIANLNANSIVQTYRLAHLYKDKLLGDGCEDYLACHKGEISMMEVMAEVFQSQ